MPLKSAWSSMENSKSCGSGSESAGLEVDGGELAERLRLKVRWRIEV